MPTVLVIGFDGSDDRLRRERRLFDQGDDFDRRLDRGAAGTAAAMDDDHIADRGGLAVVVIAI
jgi:hypothetical protein